ncbi:alkaline phosphatase, tissue-nonspecific isozyme-like [Macrosteles quadrilineatus]|uniref:alkaline phosphatase, tissue-nonspecific isozyme-like n=1 Tax=Macrosteles quadrilineatus TaxID=74068 RepID=UPI0023E0B9A6|nr:alkaline phosphatase, tissue-nonspecific isozyme-like [Macrosteles quadrilineatus]
MQETCVEKKYLFKNALILFVQVILGGGRRHWLPKVARDPEQTLEEGRRLDGRNLIDDWLRDKKKKNQRAEYVWNKQQLDAVSVASVDYLLGLFSYSHMDFEAERDKKSTGDPSLAEMTAKALKILLKNPRGFFLFVESGRIDHAHHYNNPYRALDETLSLDEAVMMVLSMVDPSDTLVVVTSDHSNVLTLGGLATPRGNPILGTDTKPSDMDGLPYSSLLYGNGPGYTSPRAIPSNTSEEERNAVHGAAVPRQWATHGGEDVPVYAQGPLARELFSGTVDQSYIPHAIAYIACLGHQKSRCSEVKNETKESTSCAVTEGPKSRSGLVLASSVMSDDNKVASKSAIHYCRVIISTLLVIILVS